MNPVKLRHDLTHPHLVVTEFDYNPTVQGIVKTIPGYKWWGIDGGPKHWSVPIEFGEALATSLERRNIPFIKSFREFVPTDLTKLPKAHAKARQFQTETAVQDLTVWSAFGINHEPGTGKSFTSIECLRFQGFTKAIIIAPAMVRKGWLEQFEEWWPDHPSVELVKDGTKSLEKAVAKAPAIYVTSYQLLDKLVAALPGDYVPEALVADELHYLSNYKAQQTVAAHRVAEKFPEARRYGLTGTLIRNHPHQMYGPLNWLWPHRWGSYTAFCERYCQKEIINTHDGRTFTKYFGVNEANAPELEKRLLSCMSRKTMKDIGLELPAFVPLEVEKDELDLADWVKTQIESGCQRVAVVCYHRDSVVKASQAIAKVATVIPVDGGETPEKRAQKLADARDYNGACVVVCTISSTKEGLNYLANFSRVLYLEMSNDLTEMRQHTKRFQRLTTREPVFVTFAYDEKTRHQSLQMKRKLQAQAALIAASQQEQDLESAFTKQTEFTQAEWLEALNEIVASETAGDV